MTAGLNHLATLLGPTAPIPDAALLLIVLALAGLACLLTHHARRLALAAYWAIHLGADAYETPARGLDEDGEVWHG